MSVCNVGGPLNNFPRFIHREKRWLQEQNDVNEALKQKIDALGVGAGGNITKQRY